MKKMKAVISARNLYLIYVFIAICLLLFGFLAIPSKSYDRTSSRSTELVNPVKHDILPDGTDVYVYALKEVKSGNNFLAFYTTHQEVTIESDDVIIYESKRSDTILGHTTGAVWNFARIPTDTYRVKITITPIYPTVDQTNTTFYQGDGLNLYYQILYRAMPQMIFAALVIIMGICLILFWSFFRFGALKYEEILYLGCFVLGLGLWSLIETQGMTLLIRNRLAASFMGYTMLMLVCIPFVQFIRMYLHIQDRILHIIIYVYCIAQSVTCFFLQAFNIADFRQTVIYIHVQILLATFYLLYGIFSNLRNRMQVHRSAVNLVGTIILITTAISDLMSYYQAKENAIQYGQYGVIIYVTFLSVGTIAEMRKRAREDYQLELYKSMAVIDGLTGCYNRNAFDKDMEEFRTQNDYQIVLFDLNNLKKCNDEFGHIQGDAYIRNCAQLIRSIYSAKGNVYRIGGDEFCAVTRNQSAKRLDALKKRMELLLLLHYNEHRTDFKMGISSGYAIHDPLIDQSFEDTRARADHMMYEDKKRQKAGR